MTMQRNWIGRSEGAEVVFRAEHDPTIELPVFTTRPDTLFGATFFVLAPEHPLAAALAAGGGQEAAVADYVRRTSALSEVERAGEKEKTGVFTGRHVVNPVNGEQIPVWVADYVLMEYGTGAIMAVPAHDERDYEFAKTHGLPIRQVVAPREAGSRLGRAYVAHSADEVLINSGRFNGMAARRRQASDHRVAGVRAAGPRPHRLPPARLAAVAAALLGLSRSRSCTATRAVSSRCPTTSCRCCCPRSRTTRPRGARRWPRPSTG